MSRIPKQIHKNSNQTISNLPIENDEEEIENNNNDDDDCFIKSGLISSKTQIEGNQSIQLVEEIDAITALIIYNTYSKKSKKNPTHDNIDQFDRTYSCLIDQHNQSNLLNNYLRKRFFTLSNVKQLKAFQQTEQSRITKEKPFK